ncbi:MAG: hypothetical protein KGJ23_03315 [Euryarchaeota archaeon]|nr:hypothetical protein [Euryarchaeota archaeon]
MPPEPLTRSLHLKTGAVAFLVLLFLIVPTLSQGMGPGAPPRYVPSAGSGATATISLQVTDQLSFVPSSPSVSSRTVTFTVTDAGTASHTFTLSSLVNQTAPSGTSPGTAPGDWFTWPNLLADRSLNGSQTASFTVTFPNWGTYQFICRYHYPSMQGLVSVLPGTSANPSSPQLDGDTFAIIAVVAAVVVVVTALVLCLRAARRRGGTGPPRASEAAPRAAK